MRATLSRLILGLLTLAVIGGAAFLALRPTTTTVDIARVEVGPMRVTVEADGWTQIKNIYDINAPIVGRLLRLNLKASDPVKIGQVVAVVEPTQPTFLSARSVEEGEAKVQTAQASRDEADADVKRAEVEAEYAKYTYNRIKSLKSTGVYSQADLEEAELTWKSKEAQLVVSRKALVTRESELAEAKAALIQPATLLTPEPTPEAACVNIASPVNGKVLKIEQESETVLTVGQTIMQVGDPRDLEIVLEMLTEDAVKVESGAEARIEEWGGGSVKGKVRHVEPYAFTKTSALGIEEQRVNVIIDFDEPYENWKQMSHGFRVVARVVVWEKSEVLKVPMGALFRQRNQWAAYVVEGGTARIRTIELGHTTPFEAEVVAGLREGDQVIVHPSDRIREGSRVGGRGG